MKILLWTVFMHRMASSLVSGLKWNSCLFVMYGAFITNRVPAGNDSIKLYIHMASNIYIKLIKRTCSQQLQNNNIKLVGLPSNFSHSGGKHFFKGSAPYHSLFYFLDHQLAGGHDRRNVLQIVPLVLCKYWTLKLFSIWKPWVIPDKIAKWKKII